MGGLLPCLWWLGTVAYFVAGEGRGATARAARALGLFDSVLLLLFLLYAIAYVVGVLASPR